MKSIIYIICSIFIGCAIITSCVSKGNNGDSSQNDSIAFKKFSSPDLMLFNLHGKVKSVTSTYSDEETYYNWPLGPRNLEFDSVGQLVNADLDICEMVNGEVKNGFFKRNDKGQIDYINNGHVKGGDTEQMERHLSYNAKGQCVKGVDEGWEYWEYGCDIIYTYDANGYITSSNDDWSTDSEDGKNDFKYVVVKTDQWGNWTEIKANFTFTSKDSTDPTIPEEKENGSYTITRKITYYPFGK